MARGLKNKFMDDLMSGMLSPVLQEVKDDGMTLDFQIRRNEVHIYYRGGKILGIKPCSSASGYTFTFNTNYFHETEKVDLPPPQVLCSAHAEEWITIFPRLKRAIDRYKTRKSEGAEREFQQTVSRENTYSRAACKSDYYIIDIEYQTGAGQGLLSKFDLVGILWPALNERRNPLRAHNPTLAIFEMKYGEGAFNGNSGIIEHFEKMLSFAEAEGALSAFKLELVNLFKQKRQLGLVSFSTGWQPAEVHELSDEKPQFITLIANHDLRKPHLCNIIKNKDFCKHYAGLAKYMDIRFATASFLGYGLYESCMLTLDELVELIEIRNK